MPIIVNLDVMMAKRKISLNELSGKIDITPRQPLYLKDRKGQGRALLDSRSHLPGTELPTR